MFISNTNKTELGEKPVFIYVVSYNIYYTVFPDNSKHHLPPLEIASLSLIYIMAMPCYTLPPICMPSIVYGHMLILKGLFYYNCISTRVMNCLLFIFIVFV